MAGATLVVGLLLAPRLQQLATVRRQLVALVLLAIALSLTPILLFGAITFRSELLTRQGVAVLAVGAASTIAALVAALSLQRSIMRTLDRLSASVSAFSAGDLGARAAEEGPEEVRDLAVAFNRMAENVETLVESRNEMIAWIGHDLGAPLTLMKAMLEAIEDGVAEPGRYLRSLQDQVDVQSGLISDLLELARIDAGQLPVQALEVSIRGSIEVAAGAVAAVAAKGRVTLSTSIAPDLPRAWCDPDLIERVMLNLLINAVRHTPTGGRVDVRVWSSEPDVMVAVENSGEVIPEDAITKIFDPFWRGDTRAVSEPDEQRRLGLGLTIARGMIEAQGGRIRAENREEGGVRLTFSLQAR